MRCLAVFTLCAAVMVLFTGCEPGKSDSTTGTTTASSKTHDDDHGHDHAGEDKDHDHDHGAEDKDTDAHGAAADAHSEVHGGHPISFGDAGFSAEWKHYGDNDIIDIYILNKEGKADLPIKAKSITVRQTTGDSPESFEMNAVEPNADGETAHFQRDDQRLATSMALGVAVEVEFNGEKKTATIAPHKSHDH